MSERSDRTDVAASGAGPQGWFPDPYGRFELRYFNGQRWTGDVSNGGHQLVDAQGAGVWTPPATNGPPRRRGLAIAAFVTAVSAAATGWMPLVFVVSAVAAVVGFVLGLVALRRARAQDGYGRDLAAWAIALSIATVPICVAGFFLTRYVVQQIDRYDDPGEYTLTPGECSLTDGVAVFEGTITNDDDGTRSYELTVTFSTGLAELSRRFVDVDDVRSGETVDWRTSDTVRTSAGEVSCDVVEVHGPLPFGVRPE